jgi:hypothetical protein
MSTAQNPDSGSICRGCGLKRPPQWMVPKRVWRHYIPAAERGALLLCIECWQKIVEATDRGRYQKKYGSARRVDLPISSLIRRKDMTHRFRHLRSSDLLLVGSRPSVDEMEISLMRWMSVDQLERYGDATRVIEEVKAEQPKMDREYAEQKRLNEKLTLEEWQKRFPLMARYRAAHQVKREILDNLESQFRGLD